MELKYCERCGGLLLRRAGEAVVYCGPCGEQIRELPAMQPARDRVSRAGQFARKAVKSAVPAAQSRETDAPSSSDAEMREVRIPPQRATTDFEQEEQGRMA